MKTKVLLAVTLLAGLAASAQAATIVGTKHDLSNAITNATSIHSTTQNQTCVFCHAPHNSITTKLLWNRSYLAGSTISVYTSFNSTKMRTDLGASTSLNQTSSSLLCLSCHALPTAAQVITETSNNKGGTASGTGLWTNDGFDGTGATGGMTNLTNDHPVDISYTKAVTAESAKFVAKNADATVGALRLFGTDNKMECATCHSVHDNTNTKFLAVGNNKSALCVVCHKK